MGVENNSYSITNLATSDTFYDWYSKTNTDIIGKLNFLKMYSGLSGDGVDVSINPAGGVHTFSITPSITKGISFNGPISFNDAVSFNGSTDFTTITVKVPLASGLTSGDVVRIDSSSGLTFAIANSTQNAEMFGVVSHHSGSETVVKVAGTIDNTLFTNTIENMLKISGGTFAPGTVYFLDSTKYGGVTVNDATEYGTVSKPVILGITGNKGCILPYRGIANTGFTGAGVTADLDNNTYSMVLYTTNHLNGTDPVTSISNIDVGSYVFLPKNFSSWCLGSPVTLGETACITSVSFTDGSSTPNLIIINDTTCLTTQPNAAIVTGNDYVFFGIVSKIYSKNTTTGEITLQITTDGGGFILSSTELSSLSGCVNKPSDTVGGINLYRSTVQFINTSLGDPGRFQSRKTTINTASGSPSVPEGYGVIGIPISGTSVLFRVVRTAYGKNTITSGSAATLVGGDGEFEPEGGGEGEDLPLYALAPLSGGGGLSGGTEYDNLLINGGFDVWQRGYSTISGLSTKCTPVADRWFRIDRDYTSAGLTHGKVVTNYSVSRQEFTTNQTDVYGSPKYYLNLIHQYSGTTGYNKPRLENVTYNPYQFQANTLTLSFYAKSGITGGTLACYYTQYPDIDTFTTQTSVNNMTTVNLGSTWNRYSVPFTVSPPGFTASSPSTGLFGIGFEFISDSQGIDLANVRLDMGATPGYDMPTDIGRELNRCSPYYFKTYPHEINPGTPDSTTHCELTLGNLLTVKNYVVKYPVRTIAVPNSITLYSNVTGDVNEAFNVSAGNDMKMTGGSAAVCPWSAALRSYRVAILNSPTIVVSSYNTSQMMVNIQNGAFSLDTLQFHYVIDADVYMTD